MLTYDDILSATGGHVLATSPAIGWARADGSWEIVRALDKRTRSRLMAVGMAGADLNAEQERKRAARSGRPGRSLRGKPAGPDELAWWLTEIGRLSAAQSTTWDAAAAVEWYVSAVLGVQDARHATTLDDQPEPDPLPAWVDTYLARLACPVKRDYAAAVARAVYWGWPDPDSLGRGWEGRVWAKFGRRYAAELTRIDEARERRYANSERAQ